VYLVGFIIGIYHYARSPESQIRNTSLRKPKCHRKCDISQRLPSLKIVNIATAGIFKLRGDACHQTDGMRRCSNCIRPAL